jgi:lipopolysaccharide export system permease protein
LLRIGGEALVETGRLTAAIGVWTPNILFAVFGISLFYLAYKEISLWHRIKIYFWRKSQKIEVGT